MKVLHLLRHAKSDWGDLSLDDHARPLNARGVKAAKAMGRTLAAEGFATDVVFCSTAVRARQTLDLLRRPLRPLNVRYDDALYMVSPRDLLEFIRRAPETSGAIMVVGHNPATHDAALTLIGRAAPGQRPALATLKQKYPTGALCTIRFAIAHWRQVTAGTGLLLRFLRPRDLVHELPVRTGGKLPPRR
jgi:phosphohistidine phosphatase